MTDLGLSSIPCHHNELIDIATLCKHALCFMLKGAVLIEFDIDSRDGPFPSPGVFLGEGYFIPQFGGTKCTLVVRKHPSPAKCGHR